MGDSYGCGGVLGTGINSRGQPSGGGYPVAKRDMPFKDDGSVIIHRATGKVVAETQEQRQAFFTGNQVPKRKKAPRNSVSQAQKEENGE